jgi:lysophospholipase L1-like esterase
MSNVTENHSATGREVISRVIPAMYLIHLLVPLGLALDLLLSFGYQPVGRTDMVALFVLGVWVIAGLVAFLLFGKRKQFLVKAAGPLLTFYVVLLTLGAVEAGLRLAGAGAHPGVWKPGVVTMARAGNRPGLPGVPGPAKFTANEMGLRGPAFPSQKGIYKIITVGGSTTQCGDQDDLNEWPHLLMEGLNAPQKDSPVWVGNAGVSGHTAVHHLMLLRSLPILSQVNMLIFLIGVNDLQATWSFQGAATQDPLQLDGEEFLRRAGIDGVKRFPLYKKLRLYKLARSAKAQAFEVAQHEDTRGPSWYDQRRMQRAAGPQLPAPDLRIGLREYATRIQEIAQECKLRGLRCLFLTQPSMWRENLTPAEQKLLWFGWVGPLHTPKGFVSIREAAAGMDAFNGVVKETCAQWSLECLDLAALVPKDTSAFFDDVHFNDSGARIVAQALVHYLLSTAPFSKAPSSRATEQH